MPAEREQMAALAHRIAANEVAVDMIDWSGWTDEERRTTLGLAALEIRWRADRASVRSRAHRRAFALLKSWLTPEQQRDLRVRGEFYVTGSAGGRYRILPRLGLVWRVERHGKRDYARASYCLHDEEDDGKLPGPDVSLGHVLLLTTDEPTFLALANARVVGDLMWNGAWRRRLNAARRKRSDGAGDSAGQQPRSNGGRPDVESAA